MTDFTRLSRRSFLATPLVLGACTLGSETFRVSGPTMGTNFNVVAIDPSGQLTEQEVIEVVKGTFAEVNNQMSNWDPTSEISRFNAQTGTAPVAMSPALAEVMGAAVAVHDASGARFDTTIGPLIELWGFGAPGPTTVPSDAEIADAQLRSGHANTLKVDNGTLRKTQPTAQIYLAAIGKGYGADRVGRALELLGIRDYMIEIGGDLYASGLNPEGVPWQIGIEAPVANRRDLLEVIGVSDLGLASSGDYRNFFQQDGRRFAHIVDPRTGRPVTHGTASATVLAQNAMFADAWATALHTMGMEEGLALAEEKGIAVQFAERLDGPGSPRFKTTSSTMFKTLTA